MSLIIRKVKRLRWAAETSEYRLGEDLREVKLGNVNR